MQRVSKASIGFAIAVTVAAAGMRGHAQTLEELERNAPATFIDGVESYIYGYPLLMFGVTGRTGTTVPDDHTRLGAAPLNQFGKEMVLPNSSFNAVVLPSTTTLYASSFLNLKSEPVILHIPNVDRFFILQMLDAWTEVSPMSPGSRLHSQEGDYALVGPDFTGDIPETVHTVIKMPTNSMWIIGRFYTTGTTADIDDIKNSIYPGLTLTPLSKYIKPPYNKPDDLPLDPIVDYLTPPLAQVAAMDACAFFGNMGAMMQTNLPIPKQDDDILPKLTGVGLKPGDPFDCTKDANKLPTLQLAVAAARRFLSKAPTPPETRTGWTVSLNVGTYGDHYLLRAEVAQQALGANNPEDAVYGYTQNDGTGANLDGTKNYTLHFDPPGNREGIPPVNGFWSLTIYDKDGKLVKNDEVSYNALGGAMVQGHSACFNADGSMDIYVQPNRPSGGIALCNWLPTPNTPDKFIFFLRMYWPKEAILHRLWVPPPIVKN